MSDSKQAETTMKTTNVPTLNQYWEVLAAHLLPFSPEEQRAAVTLYLEVRPGRPGRRFAKRPDSAREPHSGRFVDLRRDATQALMRA